MKLSSDLLSQFVKKTTNKQKESSESVVYGTVKIVDGATYAQLDGSELLTPVNTTATTKEGDRVTVMIKNHTATVTGNITAPSATKDSVDEVGAKVDQFNVIVADRVNTDELNAITGTIENLKTKLASISKLEAVDAEIESLIAKFADIEYINANDIEAVTATLESLEATFGTFTDISTEDLNALEADIGLLRGYTADFTYVSAEVLEAVKADIKKLDVDKLSAEEAELKYATIEKLDADVGEINTLIFGSATGTTISTTFANAIIAVLANAQIKSAMIESLSADKITAGSIKTNDVRIVSEDGKMVIAKETIQISDDTKTVRVQIGKDASNDYSITIWDAAGEVMFASDGITDKAIKKAIIRNDMVADNANISADKIDITSLFKVINEDGSHTLKSSKILVDADNQTLDIAFESMTTQLSEVQEAANKNAEDMAQIVLDFGADIEGLQTQIDGSITTWFYEVAPTLSNAPAKDWATAEQKNTHLGDLYYDTITGYCYRWQVKNNTYSWQRITDTDVTKALSDAAAAQDTADQKRRVFYTEPTTPYEKGDLWVQGESGDILRCQVGKTSNQTFTQSDWIKASKYTDDTKANQNAKQIEAQGTRISVVEGKIESKIWQTDIDEATGEFDQKFSSLEQTIDGFETTVSEANTTANAANNTANTAKETANSANNTANTANNTANAAKETANSANTTANAANNTANTAKETADSAKTEVINLGTTVAQKADSITLKTYKNELSASIEVLHDRLKSIVRGANGESRMIQSEEGWYFDIRNIEGSIESAAEAIDEVQNNTNSIGESLDNFKEEMGDLTSRVFIGTTPDDGKACIYIQQDSKFKICITAEYIGFYEDSTKLLWITNKRINADSIVINEELSHADRYVWKTRTVNSRVHLSLAFIGHGSG